MGDPLRDGRDTRDSGRGRFAFIPHVPLFPLVTSYASLITVL